MAFTPSYNPVPRGTTRAEDKAARERAAERQWLAVCKAVDTRDGPRCRVCRRRCSTTAIAMTDRAERHHIVSRAQGGADTSNNVLLLCARCHAARHTHCMLQLAGDAEQRDPNTRKLNGVQVWRRTEDGWAIDKWV